MDILSIRKKAKAAATTTAPTTAPDAPATTPPMPSPTTQASTTLPTPATTLPTMWPTPSNETVMDEAPTPPTPPPMSSGRAPRPAPVDPLRGFLASYDDESDDGGAALAPVEETHVDAAKRFLSFRLLDEEYAASIMDVREILTIRSLTEVPRAPKEVLGVVSKRGIVLPVIDLATSLGLRAPDRRLRASQRVLVVGDGDRVCGLRVDSVSEVIRLQSNQIEEVPASLGQRNAGLLLGLGRAGGSLYILLDVDAVLDAFAIVTGVAPAPRTEN